jgi:hypothetical protein
MCYRPIRTKQGTLEEGVSNQVYDRINHFVIAHYEKL